MAFEQEGLVQEMYGQRKYEIDKLSKDSYNQKSDKVLALQ